MITYPISGNFSRKIFSVMFSALQYSFLHYESPGFFIDDFLFTSFQQKNDIKKGKYPNEIQILSFLQKQMNDLFDAKDT